MDRKKRTLQQVGLALVILLAMIILFVWYTVQNRERMEEQNKNYAADSARLMAFRIDEELTNALNLIETYAYFVEQSLQEPVISGDMLHEMEDNALFDVMLFTDADGINHTSDGRTTDVTKRNFYRNGMEGRSGISIIFDSPFFDETMTDFYAPVRCNGEIAGVLIGAFLAEEYLEDMLSTTYFGEEAGVYLCLPDGRIIASSSGEKYETTIIDMLVDRRVIDSETAVKVGDVFENGGEGAFICDPDSGTDNICVMYLPKIGYVLVQTFPKSVTRSMIREENIVGIRLEIILIILFAVYIITLLVHGWYQKRRLEQENQEMSYVIDGVNTLFSRFAMVDLEADTYQYLAGTRPVDSILAASGRYEDLREYLSSLLIEENDRQKFAGQISRESIITALEQHSNLRFECHVMRSGQPKWEHVNIICLERNNGKASKVLFVRQNITEVKEQELRNQERLQNALMEAQHANRAKTTFLSNMSHDIRTPMNAIIGFTTIALSHIDNKEQVKEYLQKVLSSSNHLLSLINDILDMSRIESGKVQIREQECNLAELMHNLINIIQPQVKAKQLKLAIDTYEVENEDVIADPLKLNQVFINLLSNAVKYTPADGSISFRIMQKKTVQPGYGEYLFIVKDNGIGMSQEFVQHIFEPFERETTVTQSGIQGTGLGMAITKNIVEMMNGTISVESETGKGSVFTVELSLKLQDVEKTAEQIGELNGLRALVVDDDLNVCDGVCRMLKQIGMRAEWTTSGKEAADCAKIAADEGDAYHTYIIDWQMPETSGVETARMIRDVVGPDAHVIIMTAYDWSDIEEEAEKVGVTAFCAKPLFMSNLKTALLAASDHGKKEEEAPVWTLEDFSGKRVLLVEDIEMNREIAEMILTESGFVVESAPDGTDAVAMVKNSEEYYYDVILMDIQMPIMNGYEATRTIRALPRKDVNTLPIIAMTANALEEDKETALKNGMNAHIAKPLDMEAFMGVLRQFLG